MRNDSIINQKKNNITNQSDIIFNLNKNIIANKKFNIIDNESKNNKNQIELIKKFNKLDININENRKENNNLFNNYIFYNRGNAIKNFNILNTINSMGSHNTDNELNNYKASFNIFSNPKKISPYNSTSRYIRYNKEETLRDKILKDQINKINKKISLPKITICNEENKRNLSLNKKYNKISIIKLLPQRNISHSSIKKSSYSLHSLHIYNGLKDSLEYLDKYKIDLFSTISKSSNILIPLISSKNNKNYIKDENNKNEEQNNIKYNHNDNIKENNKTNKDSNIKLNKNLETNNYNLLLNIDKSFITKLHKIKIEKVMMGNRIFEKMNKNLLNNEYNGLITFENNIINSKLPLINGLNYRNYISKNRTNKKIKIKLK